MNAPLTELRLENFTLFPKAHLDFGKNLNVFVGENGTGKTHLLKAAYSGLAVTSRFEADGDLGLKKQAMGLTLHQKLIGVFRPNLLAGLIRRKGEAGTAQIRFKYAEPDFNLSFSFSRAQGGMLAVEQLPKRRLEKQPVYLPTRELLTLLPNFVSVYETTRLPFDETWRDTCILLGVPLLRGEKAQRSKVLLKPLEEALGGKVETDEGGRFYLKTKSAELEMHLVAEGLRKIAMLTQLIANGCLLDGGYLFWDEPEANLNPRIIKLIARIILEISYTGVQVFIATHSLFLLRELHILQQQRFSNINARCFGLHLRDGAVSVMQGNTMDEIGDISSLDEELAQSDRYLQTEAEKAGSEQ